MDISIMLSHKLPLTQWSLNGDSYEGLEWLSEDIPKPSLQQLESWNVEVLELITKEKNNTDIISQIEKLEQKLIRPMTAMINNTATDTDRQVFNDIKAQIAELRGKLL
jgi:hypothetical protein